MKFTHLHQDLIYLCKQKLPMVEPTSTTAIKIMST